MEAFKDAIIEAFANFGSWFTGFSFEVVYTILVDLLAGWADWPFRPGL